MSDCFIPPQNIACQRRVSVDIDNIHPFIGMPHEVPASSTLLHRAVTWYSKNHDDLIQRAVLTGFVVGVTTPVITGVVLGAIHKDAYLGLLVTILTLIAECATVQVVLPLAGLLVGSILYCASLLVVGAVDLARYVTDLKQTYIGSDAGVRQVETNKDKLRACATILSSQLKTNEEKKNRLLQKALAEVTDLNIALGDHARFAVLSETNKAYFISVTDKDIYILIKALANMVGRPEWVEPQHARHPAECLITILSALHIHMVSFADSSHSIAHFAASLNTPSHIKLKTCCLCNCRQTPEMRQFFLYLASKVNRLHALHIKENTFPEAHLSLVTQVLQNNVSLTALSLEENQISEQVMEEIALFITHSSTLEKLSVRANNGLQVNKIVNGHRYTEFIHQNVKKLMLAVSKNTSLSVVYIVDRGLKRWVNTQDALTFFEALKTHPSLTLLQLSSSIAGSDDMVVERSVQAVIHEVLMCNAMLIQIALKGLPCLQNKEINQTVHAWLAGNKVVRQIENKPNFISKELLLCASTLPTEVIRSIDRYILWQGKFTDLERKMS